MPTRKEIITRLRTIRKKNQKLAKAVRMLAKALAKAQGEAHGKN